MSPSTIKLFSCTICDELLGESTFSIKCGHVFHQICLMEFVNRNEQIFSCPTCRSPITGLFKLYPTENEKFKVIKTEELNKLQERIHNIALSNKVCETKISYLTSRLKTSEDDLKQSQITFNEINESYLNQLNSDKQTIKTKKKNRSADNKFNEERSKRILLQKEVYEYQAKCSVELNELKSELEKLKSEIASEQASTSSKKARRKNTLPRQIQSPSRDGFLSNCHFWIVDELRKVSGATNHLYFNEQCVQEHGGTVAYHYTNMVTHVIGISQKNVEVTRGLDQKKKCATDYWLLDVIGGMKIVKPWLAHHFPIPYSEDDLPYQNKQIAIANFDKNQYYKVRAMAEVTGATVNNNISRSTYIVITLKLEGEMIKQALSLNKPVVNVQWINDILLGEQISLKHFRRKKYQKYDMQNPFRIDYNKVSHLMEAWDERPKVPNCELPFKRNVQPTNKNKKMKTCIIQEFLPSDVDNGNGNNISGVSSILAPPMAPEPPIMSSEYATRKEKKTKTENKHK